MAQLVWAQTNQGKRLCVLVPEHTKQPDGSVLSTVCVSGLTLPIVTSVPPAQVLYRHPIAVHTHDGELRAGPVFAILTAMRKDRFAGNRADIRALSATLQRQGGFLYVLPVANVCQADQWQGYVRVAPHRWSLVPCPRPEAIYNRIPFRNLERTPEAGAARRIIEREQIPMFNPEYFNKANIYRTVSESPAAARFLPTTELGCDLSRLDRMLRTHGAVYLKPCGGSIGHGMLKIETTTGGFMASSLKNGSQVHDESDTLANIWSFVVRHRVPGRYVIQAAKTLLTWDGRPADFRVLLQKHDGQWGLVGRGVRVAGEGSITTHVPNGGSVVSADRVLQASFGARAADVDEELTQAVLALARAIDDSYHGRLGEMSMDIGIESSGRIWFLEANSKPMKFDEPLIRQASLEGIVRRLMELRSGQERSFSPVH